MTSLPFFHCTFLWESEVNGVELIYRLDVVLGDLWRKSGKRIHYCDGWQLVPFYTLPPLLRRVELEVVSKSSLSHAFCYFSMSASMLLLPNECVEWKAEHDSRLSLLSSGLFLERRGGDQVMIQHCAFESQSNLLEADCDHVSEVTSIRRVGVDERFPVDTISLLRGL